MASTGKSTFYQNLMYWWKNSKEAKSFIVYLAFTVVFSIVAFDSRPGKIQFYVNSYVKETFEGFVEKHHRAGERVRVVIMEMSPVSHVDATAMHALREMMEDFVEQRQKDPSGTSAATLGRTLTLARVFSQSLGETKLSLATYQKLKDLLATVAARQ